MFCLKAESFALQGQKISPYFTQLNFKVDACHKIAPDAACKTEAEVKEKASEFYINYLVISQEFNPQTNDHKSSYVYSTINERFDLEDNRNIILNQQVEKNVVIRSEDHLFGTSFYSDENDMFNYKTQKRVFYEVSTQSTFNSVGTGKDQSSGYFNSILTQQATYVSMNAVPQNFIDILSILGGFVTLVCTIIGWIIQSYQKFQFRKSSVKKMYFYTRTKNQSNTELKKPAAKDQPPPVEKKFA
jgi:hypothetical protein